MYSGNGNASFKASTTSNGGGAPGEWTTSLCGCMDDPSNSCGSAGMIFCVLGCFAYLYSCTYRTKLRGLYSLSEDPCGDCLVHWCCAPCAICQEYRELKNRGLDPSIGLICALQGGCSFDDMVGD
ncbi:hypothetical protein Syun_021598 [Stephania yunnanensis]|uniref:Uncharacterized protein n=1 Tax=Stephania yunnanensis TaxID=152371 RepID=A0AAP0IFX8_9MAGN